MSFAVITDIDIRRAGYGEGIGHIAMGRFPFHALRQEGKQAVIGMCSGNNQAVAAADGGVVSFACYCKMG